MRATTPTALDRWLTYSGGREEKLGFLSKWNEGLRLKRMMSYLTNQPTQLLGFQLKNN